MHRPSFRSCSVVIGLFLMLGACAKKPALAPNNLSPAPGPDASTTTATSPGPFTCSSNGELVPDDAQRICVPYAGTPRGDGQALLTVVMFSDFECPYCKWVLETLSQLEQLYPGKLRLYFRHLPLPFHRKAKLAAQAAVAAENQGRFWPMHDLLFAQQPALARPNLIQYAQSLGLDMDRFGRDLDAPETAKRVEEDQQLAFALFVRGTPSFFINGRPIRGAVPLADFQNVIDDELERARKMGFANGDGLYAALMQGQGQGQGKPVAPTPPSKIPTGDDVFKIEVGHAPSRGPVEAPVTLVVFSDFQCPFCARLEASLSELDKAYPGKLRFVWKNAPLPFHRRAKPSAEAAMAAHAQGKFWPMQAKLLENQQALDDQSLERYAREVGLDMKKFKAAMASHKFAAAVEADIRQGDALGVEGTPTTFVNGYPISGAQPAAIFKARVDQELAKAAGQK